MVVFEVCAVVCPAVTVDNVMYRIVVDLWPSGRLEFFGVIRDYCIDSGGGPGLGKVNCESLGDYEGLEVS